jgi:hypothetical protein
MPRSLGIYRNFAIYDAIISRISRTIGISDVTNEILVVDLVLTPSFGGHSNLLAYIDLYGGS